MKSHSHAGSLVSKGFQRNRSHQCTKKEQNIYIGSVRYCIWIAFLYHFECKISKEPVLPLNIHPFIQVNCWGFWLWLLPQEIPNWCPFAPWQHLSAWPRRKETPPWEKRKSKDSPNKCENNMPPKLRNCPISHGHGKTPLMTSFGDLRLYKICANYDKILHDSRTLWTRSY